MAKAEASLVAAVAMEAEVVAEAERQAEAGELVVQMDALFSSQCSHKSKDSTNI